MIVRTHRHCARTALRHATTSSRHCSPYRWHTPPMTAASTPLPACYSVTPLQTAVCTVAVCVHSGGVHNEVQWRTRSWWWCHSAHLRCAHLWCAHLRWRCCGGVECDSGGVFHDHVLVYRRVVTGAGECACVVCQWCARSTECMPVVRF